MRGETRRKARRCIRRRSIAARIAVKTTGAAVQGAGERPSPRAPRRTPEGAMRGFVSGRSRAEPSRVSRLRQDSPPKAYMYTPSGSKDAQIARPAQGVPLPEPWPHIVRQTSTAQASRTLSGKPARHRKPAQHRQRFRSSALYMQGDSESSTVNGPSLRRWTFMSAPKRPVPTRSGPSAARRSATKRS